MIRFLSTLLLAILLIGCGGGDKPASDDMGGDTGTAEAQNVGPWAELGMDFSSANIELSTPEGGIGPVVSGMIRYSGAAPSEALRFHLVMTDANDNLMGPISFEQDAFQPGEEREFTVPLPPKNDRFDPAMIDPESVRINVAPESDGKIIHGQRPDSAGD